MDSAIVTGAHMRRLAFLLSSTAAIVFIAPAWAQAQQVAPPASPSTSGQPEATAVGEIIVTAQKRSERLQDVPLSVNVVTAGQVEAHGIVNTIGLVQSVPSITFTQGSNANNTTFRIRGIGTQLFGFGTEASVSVVVDGVVEARQTEDFGDLADIQRIEVLNGPQGMLFGRNATGGVINIVTAAPSRTVGGAVQATVAQGDEYHLKGDVTGPINDQMAVRISGYYNSVGGWIHNVANNSQYGGDTGDGLRGKLDWEVNSKFDLLFAASYARSDYDCCQSIPIKLVNPTLIALYADQGLSNVTLNNKDSDTNAPTYYKNSEQTYSVTGKYDLGFADLTSISAYQYYNIIHNADVDALNTPAPIFVGTQAPNYGSYDVNGGQAELSNLSQEVRLSSKSGDKLDYVAGLYWSDVTINRPFETRRAVCLPNTGVLGQPCTAQFQSAASDSHFSSQTAAAFGQLEYPITNQLKLIAGLREQYDAIHVSGETYGPVEPGDVILPGDTDNAGSRSINDVGTSGKAGLQYEFSRNSQAYLTYTRGFKAGGLNTEINTNWTNNLPILPETVNAYELGYKGSLFDRRLNFSADLFLEDYTDLQVQTSETNSTTGVTKFIATNAGASTSKGFELQAAWQATHELSFITSASYTDATVNIKGLDCPLEYQAAGTANVVAIGGAAPNNVCYNQQSKNGSGQTVLSGPIQNVVNGQLPSVPRWRVSFSPRYEAALPGGDLAGFAQLDIDYQSAEQFALEQDPLLTQRAYTLVNATVGLRPQIGRWQISFFVKNLFDQRYFTVISHGTDLAGPANPYDLFAWRPKDASRYVGGSLGLKF